MITRLILAAACLLLASSAASQDIALPRSTVAIVDGPDGLKISVKAKQVSFKSLMAKIAADCGRTVEGHELISRDPEVTALLEGADLREALLVIAGSVGLRATLKSDVLIVSEDLGPYPARREVYTRSQAWYARAMTANPDSILAPEALWNRARMWQQLPGEELQAGLLFTELYEEYSGSDLASRARIEASRAFSDAGEWEEAITCLERLLATAAPKPIRTRARRLLAEALTNLADDTPSPQAKVEFAERAHLQLDVLDAEDGAVSSPERRRRYIVRSRAFSLTGDPAEALRYLDLARANGSDAAVDPEVSELRARAFQFAGQYEQAVRAWLMYAEMTEGGVRSDALLRAAEAAHEGGSHLTAISIAKLAANSGQETIALKKVENRALAALDLPARHLDAFDDQDLLARGADLIKRGMHAEAAESLRPMFDRRQTLVDSELRLELGLTYAKALAAASRMNTAVFVLRKTAQEQVQPADRRRVYLAASSLFEDAGDLELAIKALEGRL